MDTRPEEVLDEWVRGVNAGDVERVCGLYDAGCTLWPTFAPDLLGTEAEFTGYFEGLAGRENASVSVRPATVKIQAVGSTVFVLTGVYDFRFDLDGEPASFDARFTFVIDTSRPRPIRHHHSSQVPLARGPRSGRAPSSC